MSDFTVLLSSHVVLLTYNSLIDPTSTMLQLFQCNMAAKVLTRPSFVLVNVKKNNSQLLLLTLKSQGGVPSLMASLEMAWNWWERADLLGRGEGYSVCVCAFEELPPMLCSHLEGCLLTKKHRLRGTWRPAKTSPRRTACTDESGLTCREDVAV